MVQVCGWKGEGPIGCALQLAIMVPEPGGDRGVLYGAGQGEGLAVGDVLRGEGGGEDWRDWRGGRKGEWEEERGRVGGRERESGKEGRGSEGGGSKGRKEE